MLVSGALVHVSMGSEAVHQGHRGQGGDATANVGWRDSSVYMEPRSIMEVGVTEGNGIGWLVHAANG
jgi:hypothetical protein